MLCDCDNLVAIECKEGNDLESTQLPNTFNPVVYAFWKVIYFSLNVKCSNM